MKNGDRNEKLDEASVTETLIARLLFVQTFILP
jgi:hypothetical protein